MAVSGKYAVLGAGSSLQVIDFSNPAALVVVGRTNTGAGELEVQGNYAYLIGRGLYIFDISDPTSPRYVGSTNSADSVGAVALSGNYAYLADWDAGLQVIDVSNPVRSGPAGTTPAGLLWAWRSRATSPMSRLIMLACK